MGKSQTHLRKAAKTEIFMLTSATAKTDHPGASGADRGKPRLANTAGAS